MVSDCYRKGLHAIAGSQSLPADCLLLEKYSDSAVDVGIGRALAIIKIIVGLFGENWLARLLHCFAMKSRQGAGELKVFRWC